MISGKQMAEFLKFMRNISNGTQFGKQITGKQAMEIAKLTKQPGAWFWKMFREIIK